MVFSFLFLISDARPHPGRPELPASNLRSVVFFVNSSYAKFARQPARTAGFLAKLFILRSLASAAFHINYFSF